MRPWAFRDFFFRFLFSLSEPFFACDLEAFFKSSDGQLRSFELLLDPGISANNSQEVVLTFE